MTQEKVVIGSEVSPIATIIEGGRDGFLVRPANVNELSHLLLKIFDGKVNSEDIGRNARQKILDLFNTQKMIQEMTKAYKGILESSKFI